MPKSILSDEGAPEAVIGRRCEHIVGLRTVREVAGVDPGQAVLDHMGSVSPVAEPGDQSGDHLGGMADDGAGPGSRPDAAPLPPASLSLTLQSEAPG